MRRKRRAHQYATTTGDNSAPQLFIADGDAAALARIYQWLIQDGFDVQVCESGEEMLMRVYAQTPYLLVIGSHLPDMDGNNVSRQIKADDRLGFVPIIMIDDPVIALPGDQVNYADVTLPRPLNLDDLREWVYFLLHIRAQFARLTRENERLIAASQSIDLLKRDIISNVSHELRTPLVQVKAAVSLLVEDFTNNNAQDQPSVAEMAQQAVARLENVVENIRQLAQTHDVHTGPVNVQDSVDLALRFLERSWLSRNAADRVETQVDDNLPLIRADKRALARLLQLLLDNALKFSEVDAPVYLIARRLEHQAQVWIGVRDFGIGIPPHEHDRVFDAFYQVDGSSTRRYGGTGSGLALAGLLARSMHTVIRVDSMPGEGSTFSIVLPIAMPGDFEIAE